MEANMEKNELLRTAAKEFAEKLQKLSTPRELAIVGSVAGNDPYPNDLDLALILRTLDEIPTIARYARQMSRWYYGWDVFVFSEDLSRQGRICYRRECPGHSVDCAIPGCGVPAHIRVVPTFEYDETLFFTSPIDVLWTTYETSRFLARKKELGIVELKKYPTMNDITIACRLCGKPFVFTGSEQKWYQKQGFDQPKRCPECREEKWRDEG